MRRVGLNHIVGSGWNYVKFSMDYIKCTEKTSLKASGGGYVGVRAAPAPPHIVLFLRLTFFQRSHKLNVIFMNG